MGKAKQRYRVTGNKVPSMVRGWWAAPPLDPQYEARMLEEHRNLIHYWSKRLSYMLAELTYDEVVAEASLAALRAIRTWSDGSSLPTYIGNGIRLWFRRMADDLRIEKGRGLVSLDAEQWDDGPSLAKFIADDSDIEGDAVTRAVVRDILSRLTDTERIAFERSFLYGETGAEIAGRLGCSQFHVCRIIRNATRRLRQEMGVADG